MKKRLFYWLLVCCMVFGMMPTATVVADDNASFMDVKTIDGFYDEGKEDGINSFVSGTSATEPNLQETAMHTQSSISDSAIAQSDALESSVQYNENESNETEGYTPFIESELDRAEEPFIESELDRTEEPFTEGELDRMEAVDTEIKALTDSASFDYEKTTLEERKKAVEDLLDDLVRSNLVKKDSIAFNEDSSVIGFEYIDGVWGAITLKDCDDCIGSEDFDDSFAEIETESSSDLRSLASETTPKTGTALFLTTEPEKGPEKLKEKWDSDGLFTTIIREATVADFRDKLAGYYNVICIRAHGETYSTPFTDYPVICLREEL